MRWKGRRQSQNIEDRRASRGAAPKIAAGGGIGVILVAVIAMVFGADAGSLAKLLGDLGGAGGTVAAEAQAPAGQVQESAAEAELSKFVATVLADTEDVWNRMLAGTRTPYAEPKLVLFRDGVSSACGFQSSAVGPFYCPGDSKVYLDLGFFDDLARRHGSAGDFAQAYVIAHEVGHHVQNLLGIFSDVHRKQRGMSETRANELSVRLELQADFFAGLWAHHAQEMNNILERGDVEEALNAASQIGDDTLQRKARGSIQPESFTHGSAAQRVRWFRRGLETGELEQGDTFSVPYGEL